ncbi:hypothetical protein NW064_06395 [Mycoplasmopsis felis]|uniref:hypothetical protein n=2 Tax=Mycoplasmopsis felis TaxID=33923 RepID=UPI0021AE3B37|nr:hypothetical protein [Mycoplasmopsis felis]UWW00785.1 hypothetical protein NW064_06395 [Mycoplasmopsis felis]
MDKKVNIAMLTFFNTFEGIYPLKKIKKRRSISRNLKVEEFYKIYQEYNSTRVHGALKMLFKISPKVQNNNKRNNVWRIKKIINHYNLGMEDLLVTKSSNLRKKGSGRPRKK